MDKVNVAPVGQASKRVISIAAFRDKVLGCWLGKNAGGTLGGPFEEPYGREDMYNVEWYTDLPEEGIPNDDLELQLIWFQALKECGPGLTARDLSEYWLDCVNYNFDEYGLSKENLRKGLEPPMSGRHNNWFKDCMGSPIRSEIWACVAPGEPSVAAHYAYEDAICDHAGGESVYGEVFNAVFEACAFFESDRLRLIELGLRAIPEHSQTYKAIRETVELYEGGVEWREARNRIKNAFYSPIAQYSPINLGFQTIGLLYGRDFGDAICRAVNCGWDTDCTAATAGAMIGIIEGAAALPDKWMAPLGRIISTNTVTGGIRNLRAPTDIDELTDEVCSVASTVLRYWNSAVEIDAKLNDGETGADYDFGVIRSPEKPSDRRTWNGPGVDVTVRYPEGVAMLGDRATRIEVAVSNHHPEAIDATVTVTAPEEWKLVPGREVGLDVPADSTEQAEFELSAPGSAIGETNSGVITVKPSGRPALSPVPLVLVGGNRWLSSPLFQGKTLENECGIDESVTFRGHPADWRELWRPGNDLYAAELFGGRCGVLYLWHAIHASDNHEAIIGVSNNGRMRIWLNGDFLHESRQPTRVRPSQGVAGGDGSNYAHCRLEKGWNQVLIKLESKNKAAEAHFVIAGRDDEHPINVGHALLGLTRTRFPWE